MAAVDRGQSIGHEMLFLAVAAMESCYLVPLVLALSQVSVYWPPGRAGLAFFGVVLVSCYLARLLDVLNLSWRVQRDLALAVLLVWLLLVLRVVGYRHVPALSLGWLAELVGHLGDRALWSRDLTIILATLLFWWRGLELAKRSLDADAVGFSFRLGVILTAVAVAIVSSTLDWTPTPWVFAFFFSSLVAVAIARAEEVSRWRTGGPFPFGIAWLASIVGAAGVVLLLAVVLISGISGENILRGLAYLGPVWDLLRYALLAFVSVLFTLLSPLLTGLARALAGLMDQSVAVPTLAPFENAFLEPADFVEGLSPWEPYEPLLRVLGIMAAMLLVTLAVGGIWRARARLGQVQADSVWANREKTGLGDRLRNGLGALAARLGVVSRWWATVSIRRIYAQMLAAAARRGQSRAPSETPYEFVQVLTGLWPSEATAVNLVTEAYVQSHYGQIPETDEGLARIRSAWERIKEADRALPVR
jgi:hypothetical protein